MTTLTFEQKQQAEQDEKVRRKNRLFTIAIGLTAQNAFKGYRVVKKENEFDISLTLQDADGHVIHLSADRYGSEGRLFVSGSYPQPARGGYQSITGAPSVTVALDKDIDRIGKDIARRFLVDYFAKHADVAGQVAQANARHEKLIAAGKRVAARLRVNLDETRINGEIEVSGYRPEWIKVNSYDGESFKLTVELKDEALLNRLLDVLNPRKEKTSSTGKKAVDGY